MRSQREYKVQAVGVLLPRILIHDPASQVLLERYNPFVDSTSEERIEAIAKRVGLNMPVTPLSQE